MKSFFRKIALVLAFAMVFTAMPMSVFAECTHTPNADPNGIVRVYITETESFKICTTCNEKYDIKSHTNNGSNVCTDCGVTLDAGTNHHEHQKKNAFVSRDEYGHTYECEVSGCTGVFETHEERIDGEGNTVYAIGPMGHNVFCDICDQQYGSEKHIPGGVLVTVVHPETNKEGHAAECNVCGAPAIATFEEHTPVFYDDGTPYYCSDGDGYHYVQCGVCYNGIESTKTAHTVGEGYTPVWNDNGETLGHAPACSVCNGPVGEVTPHKTSNNYGPVWGNGSEISTEHSLVCDDCGAHVGATEAHIPSGEWGSDGEYHFELCDLCGYNIESTKALHTAGDEWVMFDETSHVAVCAVCRADMDSIKENHTAPDADGNCSKCYVPVDANGAHKHEIINEWVVEWSQHVKPCSTCGRAVEVGFHSDANGDKKCDVCNASVEAITEDGEHIYYVHEHVKSDEWSIDIDGHNQKCAGCDAYPFGREHTDANGDRACDVCGAVYVVKIDAPSDNDYYTITNKIDESYVMGLPENERSAFFEALDAILEVAGDYAFNIFEITCKDKTTGDLVSEPDTTFTFTITLPTGIIEAPQGRTIQWVMYRYHNGVVEKLPIRDNGNGTGSFESDKFSYYVLDFEFVSTTHNHVWGYNTQYDAAAHWDYCHVCGAKGAVVAHSYKDGVCSCGWKMTTTATAGRTNPATGVTAEMLGE